MIARVVDVAHPSALRLQQAHLIVEQGGVVAGKIPIEDMGFLVLDGPQITMSQELLAACAGANVAVVISDLRHQPISMLLPFEGNALSGKIMRQQVQASLPTKKNCWQQTVQAKLKAQAKALGQVKDGARAAEAVGRLLELAKETKAGDSDNREGTGAALYFRALFGGDFVRERDFPGTNRLLNYGYSVLRAAMARALVGAGLHPAFAVQHHHQNNAFALADDAMEPLRPMVDLAVFRVEQESGEDRVELGPPVKRQLVEWIQQDVKFNGDPMPFMTALHYYAADWRRVLCEGGRRIAFPTW